MDPSSRTRKIFMKLGISPPVANCDPAGPVFCEYVSSPSSDLPISSQEKVKAWAEHARSASCPGFKYSCSLPLNVDEKQKVRRVLFLNENCPRLQTIPEIETEESQPRLETRISVSPKVVEAKLDGEVVSSASSSDVPVGSLYEHSKENLAKSLAAIKLLQKAEAEKLSKAPQATENISDTAPGSAIKGLAKTKSAVKRKNVSDKSSDLCLNKETSNVKKSQPKNRRKDPPAKNVNKSNDKPLASPQNSSKDAKIVSYKAADLGKGKTQKAKKNSQPKKKLQNNPPAKKNRKISSKGKPLISLQESSKDSKNVSDKATGLDKQKQKSNENSLPKTSLKKDNPAENNAMKVSYGKPLISIQKPSKDAKIVSDKVLSLGKNKLAKAQVDSQPKTNSKNVPPADKNMNDSSTGKPPITLSESSKDAKIVSDKVLSLGKNKLAKAQVDSQPKTNSKNVPPADKNVNDSSTGKPPVTLSESSKDAKIVSDKVLSLGKNKLANAQVDSQPKTNSKNVPPADKNVNDSSTGKPPVTLSESSKDAKIVSDKVLSLGKNKLAKAQVDSQPKTNSKNIPPADKNVNDSSTGKPPVTLSESSKDAKIVSDKAINLPVSMKVSLSKNVRFNLSPNVDTSTASDSSLNNVDRSILSTSDDIFSQDMNNNLELSPETLSQLESVSAHSKKGSSDNKIHCQQSPDPFQSPVSNGFSSPESPLAELLPESLPKSKSIRLKQIVTPSPFAIKKQVHSRSQLLLSSSRKNANKSLDCDNEDTSSIASNSVCSKADSRYSFRTRKPSAAPLDEQDSDSSQSSDSFEWTPSDPRINDQASKQVPFSQPQDEESDASDEENVFVTLPKKTQQKAWHKALAPREPEIECDPKENTWEDSDLVMVEREPIPLIPIAEDLSNPIEYFIYFFDDELINILTDFTNISSTVRSDGRKCLNVSPDEMRKFLGILLYMGIVHLPSLRDYWATETSVSQVSKVMPYNRFASIRSNIHFYDKSKEHLLDTTDRFCKVRTLFNHMKKKCNDLDQAESDYSVDESMIPYKGKYAGSLRQYIKSKPHRFGIKLFNLAGSSGLIYDFIPYAGASTFDGIDFSKEEQNMGVGAKILIHLSRQIDNREDKALFYDNFFAGIDVAIHLRDEYKLRSIGTIRKDRIKKCPLLSDKALDTAGRGSYDTKVMNGVQIIKWKDNKIVHVVSTLAGVAPLGTAKRYNKVSKSRSDIPIPLAVQMYNTKMGGVDLHDMLVELYRTPFKAKRWYMTLISYMLDLAVVNSWLLYRRQDKALQANSSTYEKKPLLDLKQFRLSISKSLRGECNVSTPSTSRIKNIIKQPRYRPDDEVINDGYHHWPSFQMKQSRCKFCKDGFTTVLCVKCNVNLCFVSTRQCFSKFHTSHIN